MAKERVFRTICDRCAGVFEEKDTGNVLEEGTTPTPKVYLEVNGTGVVKYDDLCKKCDDRVKNLIGDLSPLPSKEEKKERKTKAKSTKKKPADKKDSKKDASTPTGEKPAS